MTPRGSEELKIETLDGGKGARILKLTSVIGVFTSCQRTNRGFGIIGLGERIRTLFQVTHVDGLLPTFNSLDEAEEATKT